MNRATSKGTQKYPVPFGKTDLKCSPLGFGCYRISDEIPLHIDALRLALKSGVNLIDTSTNYADGGSERCVGKVLKSFPREEFIVVSKVGYVQGENLDIAVERQLKGNPYPEMVKYADGCWHCLHPDFIRDQFQRTLERTGLECIDVYLLHNPEYFFSDLVHRGEMKNVAIARKEFYRRVGLAFQTLEEFVTAGKLQYYGVSSNTIGRPETDLEMTSISQLWEVAKSKHFAVIQLPMNLFESGPLLEKNNNGLSTLEFCEKNGLAVLVNRPLNAFYNDQLMRLADFHHVPDFQGRDRVQKNSDIIAQSLNPFFSEASQKETLSRKALAVLTRTPGVTCVLNGMRSETYVRDSLGAPELCLNYSPSLYQIFRPV